MIVVRRSLLLLLPLLGLVSACILEAPDIDVVGRHDFGRVNKGQTATAEFVVRNTGDAPLEVSNIATSCGCTQATIDTKSIPAGGEAVLRVAYDSAAHAEDMGKIKRYVFVSSNDPDEDDVRIELVMNVVMP